MAPIAQKRRRDEKEERRPKKKFKKVKRVDYHSSDEDDEVEGAAYDAPKVSDVARVVQQGPVATGENLKPILKRAPLKQAKVEEISVPEEDEEDEDQEQDGFEDELARNTAMNSIPPPRDAPISEGSEGEDNNDDEAKAGAENLSDLEAEADENDEPALDSSADDDDDSDSESDNTSQTSSTTRTKKKRNDPTAFATSITRILDTKLTSRKRPDPILSRSTTANEANKALSDNKLEARARAQIRAERKAALNKGRVEDVLGLKSAAGLASTGAGADGKGRVDTGRVLEEEKRLKKTAQRGVVKLFNAVRAAQVKGEEALRQARSEGVVGMRQREERVDEMSKQGFLDLISGGGKKVEA